MFYRIDSIPQHIPKYFPHLDWIWEYMGILCETLSVSQNIIMDMNNVMNLLLKMLIYVGWKIQIKTMRVAKLSY